MALRKLLGRSLLDSVIDSAGGMIAQQAGQVLRQGGRIVIYGMTVAPQAPFTMREVLRNHRLIGQNKLAFPLIDIFDYFRLDDGLKGGPQSSNGFHRATPDCAGRLARARWA